MMVWLRRLAWLTGGVLVLWVVAWLTVPPLLEWQLPLRLSAALGRTVTIGALRFEPWSLEFTLEKLTIASSSATREPLLTIDRVHANLSISTLFRRAPVIEALEIDAPLLRVSHTGDGHYDVDDLIARFTPRTDAPPSEPARFALYNLQVRNGRIQFDDRPVHRVHKIEALQLSLPFISNLPAEVEIKVEPRLAFKLNGAPLDSGAQATPFAQNKTGALTLKINDLDLLPYLGYLPDSLPVHVTRGSVSTDLSLQFAVPKGEPPRMSLRGSIGAKDLALADAADRPLLALQRLQLGLRDIQPLAHRLEFESLRVDGMRAYATRDAAGQLNLLRLVAANGPAKPDAAGAGTTASGQPPVAWSVGIESLRLADAAVLWNDAAVKPTTALQLDGLTITAGRIEWPLRRPIAVAVNGALRAQTEGTPPLAQLSIEGPLTDHAGKLGISLAAASLGAFAPYVAQTVVPQIEGLLTVHAQLEWSDAVDAPRLQLAVENLTLDALKVREGGGRGARDAVALKQLALVDARVDVLERSVTLGSVKLVQPMLLLARDADGRLNLQRWIVDAPAPAERAPARAGAKAANSAWRVQLKDLLLEGGEVSFSDAAARRGTAEPLRATFAEVRLATQGLEWQGERTTAPAAVQFSARVGAPQRDRSRLAGALDYKGRIGMQPLLAIGKLRVVRFPVHLFAPYFAEQAQLALLRAEAGYAGNVSLRQLPAGLDVSAAGDILLGDVHIATLPDSAAPARVDNTEELLSWQSLALSGVTLTMKPKARPQVEIGEVALSDFYSRLVITEQGRFNLQDAVAAPAGAASASGSTPIAAATTAPASAASAPSGAGLPLDIKVGRSRLTNGRVDFSDHFVRPNYSAALTELNGQLGAFNSASRAMATLELRGRAAGTALLEISGQLNPTAKPLALDIRAKATDLELAALSPYAGKYAGYAIERGKLSMDVAYKIDAGGKLDAKNQLVLNQLTFGDRIESKDATKLPVLLAVALLKDRNGVIDINLPVSGSIDDPSFSVGGIILKVIGNLLLKAITAPFSLLSGGSKDDLSLVEFEPGTATIAASGASTLDRVAKELNDRPALKITVTGAADPTTERDAFLRAALEARLSAESRREALRAGGPGGAASAPLELGAAERLRVLKEVYTQADVPNKPRNALGFAKDIPAPEMEALLKSRILVSADAVRELALQRGIAVRDALAAKGLPSERLFLAAPLLRASGEDNAAWTPRVQLSLSTR